MTTLTPNEAFRVWYTAYTDNYAGTGLVHGETLAEQAWLAALNYAEQRESALHARVQNLEGLLREVNTEPGPQWTDPPAISWCEIQVEKSWLADVRAALSAKARAK